MEHKAQAASVQLTLETAPPPRLDGRRVVICEDIGLVHLHVRRIVERAGMEVVGSARTATEGVDTVLQERPDIVLMDLNLPDYDGLEAIRRILSVYHPCIVVLTAYEAASLRSEARRLGVCGYVTKPVGQRELVHALGEALQRQTERGTSDAGQAVPETPPEHRAAPPAEHD